MYGVNHREEIRQIFELYNQRGIILKESNEKSDVLEYFKKPNNTYDLIKESLKIKPIVKVPTAELHTINKDGSRDIVGYPTKSDLYDGKKLPEDFRIHDEVGHWPNHNYISGIDQNRITDEMGQANFHKQWKPKKSDSMVSFMKWKDRATRDKLMFGIDPYDINDEESKGSLASNCDKMLEDLWLKELTKKK